MKRIAVCMATAALAVGGARLARAERAASAGRAVDLTLEEVIEAAVYHNPEVEAALLEWRISRKVQRGVIGAFEPAFVGSYAWGAQDRENNAVQRLSQESDVFSEESEEFAVGIEGDFLSGAHYRLAYSVRDQGSNLHTNEQGEFIHEFEAFAGLTVKQPLLKGAGFKVTLAEFRLAREGAVIALHNYRKQAMTVVSRAESAYWNLAFAQEKHRMAGESVGIARKLVEDRRQRVQSGKMAELELLEAEAGLASRLALEAQSHQEMMEAMTQLKLLAADRQIGGEQSVRATGSLAPPEFDAAFDREAREAALREALRAQPDYLVRRAELRQSGVRHAYMRNQRLPQVDLTGSYGFNGLTERMGELWAEVATAEYPTWTVGVELRVPLGFGVRERNELAIAKLQRAVALHRLRAVEYEIANSVQALIHRIANLGTQIENARTIIGFYERLLDDALKRLEQGKSTSREVYAAEEELARARRDELSRIAQYREALLQWAFVRGALLRDRNLETIEDGKIILSGVLDPSGWGDGGEVDDVLKYIRLLGR